MVELSKQELDNIKNYKYSTHGLTFFERTTLEHWWVFAANQVPSVSSFSS